MSKTWVWDKYWSLWSFVNLGFSFSLHKFLSRSSHVKHTFEREHYIVLYSMWGGCIYIHLIIFRTCVKFCKCVFVVVHCRSAGTVGAVVTCPLEVVKTRLQSSTAFQAPSQRIVEPPGATGGPANNGGASELLRPEQRRKLSTTILRNRSQPQVIGGVRRVVPNFIYFLLQLIIYHDHQYIRMYILLFQAKVQATTIITNNNNNTSWPSLYIEHNV